MARDTLSDMVTHYMATALWSSTDDGDSFAGNITTNHDISDIAPETRAAMKADCAAFLESNFDAIFCDSAPVSRDSNGGSAAMAGHDFWLTRCGHGAGFWDGDWPEPQAAQLTAAAERFGNVDLYVGDDGLIYGM